MATTERTTSAQKTSSTAKAPTTAPQHSDPINSGRGAHELQGAVQNPLSASPQAMLSLQHSYGNRAVGEAIQRASVGAAGGALDADTQGAIDAARGGGQPLDRAVGAQIGGALGADFSGVKVHTGPQADALNRSLSARAFTTGSDIFFSQGAYQPNACGGARLLAHELAHVVQQGSAKPNRVQTKRAWPPAGTLSRHKPNKVQTKLKVGAANDPFEREADALAAQISSAGARVPARTLTDTVQPTRKIKDESRSTKTVQRMVDGSRNPVDFRSKPFYLLLTEEQQSIFDAYVRRDGGMSGELKNKEFTTLEVLTDLNATAAIVELKKKPVAPKKVAASSTSSSPSGTSGAPSLLSPPVPTKTTATEEIFSNILANAKLFEGKTVSALQSELQSEYALSGIKDWKGKVYAKWQEYQEQPVATTTTTAKASSPSPVKVKEPKVGLNWNEDADTIFSAYQGIGGLQLKGQVGTVCTQMGKAGGHFTTANNVYTMNHNSHGPSSGKEGQSVTAWTRLRDDGGVEVMGIGFHDPKSTNYYAIFFNAASPYNAKSLVAPSPEVSGA